MHAWLTTYRGGRLRPLPLCLWVTLMSWIGGAVRADRVPPDPDAETLAWCDREADRLDAAWLAYRGR